MASKMHETLKTHPTYNDLHKATVQLAELAGTLPIGHNVKIVCLERGGMFPGLILSHLMNYPVIPVSYSSKQGLGEYKKHTNILPYIDADTIFLVDDIFDSGKTLTEVYKFYDTKRQTVGGCLKYIYSIVLVYARYKQRTAEGYKPDLYWYEIDPTFTWVNFPYEVKWGNISVDL